MNIVKNINQYNEDYVFFSDPIKNNIMNNGSFIRIIYSTPYFVLNGIYLFVSIVYTSTDKYFNKFKCTFDSNKYKIIIDKIQQIESGILTKCNIRNKTPQYKITEQLKNGSIKIFSDTIEKVNNNFLLKIAGVWETEYEYGVTYKFINV
jgi:cytochrome c biogenesis protein ResB